MTEIFAPLVLAVIGTFIGYIIRKLIFEKNAVPVTELMLLKEELQVGKTKLAVADQTVTSLKDTNDVISSKLHEKSEELISAKTSFASKASELSSFEQQVTEIKQQWQEAKNEHTQIQSCNILLCCIPEKVIP